MGGKRLTILMVAMAAALNGAAQAQPQADGDIPVGFASTSQPFSLFTFLWGSAVDSTLGFTNPQTGAPVEVSTSASFSKLLNELDFAFMLYGDWTSERWSTFADWTYTRISPSASVDPATGFTAADTTIKSHFADLALAYQVAGDDETRVELFGGARYYNLSNKVELRSPGGDLAASSKDDWFDAIGGVRVRAQLAPRWTVVGQADVGGGGSDHSWQLWTYVGYQFGWGSVGAGWRRLDFSRSHNGSKLDMVFSGPLLGAVARF